MGQAYHGYEVLHSSALVCLSAERAETLCVPGPRDLHRDWARIVFECLLWNYGSAVACLGGRGSGCSRPGYGISLLGGGCHSPHHRATRTYIGLGKQTLGGHKQNLVCSRIQERGAVTLQRLTQTCLWVSRGLWQRHGWTVACCRVRGTECSSAHVLMKEVTITFITPTIVWPHAEQQGGNPAPSINRKLD